MLVKVYIYYKKDTYERYKLSLSNVADWKYLTFFYAYSAKVENTVEYNVYYSNFEERCKVSKEKIIDHIWSYSFSFYAYPKFKEDGYPLQVHRGEGGPERYKFSSDFDLDCWIFHEQIWVPRDINISEDIRVIGRNMPKISIVMAYYNRREQLLYTLESLKESKYRNYEIIIVDDASDEGIDDVVENGLDIKVIKIDARYKAEKNYRNPSLVYNIGFSKASGDIVIIQNPECCHVGDVLSYVAENLQEDEYYSFSAMVLDKNNSERLRNGTEVSELEHGWYNHPVHRAKGYHFLSAIYKKRLDIIGGFPEMFSFGYWFDDDGFMFEIKRSGLRFHLLSDEEAPYVIHQWHPSTLQAKDFDELAKRNGDNYRQRLNNFFNMDIKRI